ncbi:hypothetical protein BUALT_Bualt08G0025500 [Buddleja alternifolia]|uniref:MULE transposase domain-containing protein n=1 Tax=Buddleja alternifolia TaxID=168488 RepID=A0AAV6XDV3_9LAMI|nr:hypothetical protein BUALT_Bualt08G0025500 [Buddleja alternifolia]
MDMKHHAKLHIPAREMNVYVEFLTELENNEGDDVVFLGEDTEADDVVGEDVGAVGEDEGNSGGDVDDSDDLLDSDYDMEEEWGDDDQMFQRNIDPGIELGGDDNIEEESSDSNESGEDDLVASEDDLDEHRFSDEEDESPKVYVRCAGDDCQWRINVVKVKNEATFRIREYNSYHSCPQTFHVKNVNTDWLSKKILKKFKSDPKRNVKGFRQDVIEEINCHVSKDQTYRAIRKALKAIEGSPDYQYTRLWDYADELRRTNPGSTIILGIEDDSDGVSFKNKETWEWFLTVLKNDLEIVNEHEFTFMSDKQKGLILAFEEVFPGSDHRFCVRHLLNNFKTAGYRRMAFKNALWSAAKATTVNEFKLRMQELRQLDEKIWLDLEERYNQRNVHRVFELRKKIASLCKQYLTVASYFTKLKVIRKAYAIVAREEKQIMLLRRSENNDNPVAYVAKGHMQERCFEIIGYTPGWSPKGKDRGRGASNNIDTNHEGS